jgi:hypothetical protein
MAEREELTEIEKEDLIEELTGVLLMHSYKIDMYRGDDGQNVMRAYNKQGDYDSEYGELVTEIVVTPSFNSICVRQVERRSLRWHNSADPTAPRTTIGDGWQMNEEISRYGVDRLYRKLSIIAMLNDNY